MTDFIEMTDDGFSLLHGFLNQSVTILYLKIDKDFKVIEYNDYCYRLLGTLKTLKGKPFESLLLPESKGVIKGVEANQHHRLKLVFGGENNLPLPLECFILKRPTATVILGEKLMLNHDEIMGKMSLLHNELINVTRELQRKNRELTHANEAITALRGIIPICSYCKGIRNDEGYWKKLEVFMSEHTEVQFSHSICPDCCEKHFPELND